MKYLHLLGLISVGTSVLTFKNGPGSKLANGGHIEGYEAIIELSEARIIAEIGLNNSALSLSTTGNQTTNKPVTRDIVEKRQATVGTCDPSDTLCIAIANGAVTCTATSPCIDGTCCGKDGFCGYKEANCGDGCQSNCGAKAMCGIDSEGGTEKCGLNLCCGYFGWCGTKPAHCIDPDPVHNVLPCQQGFGSCEIIPSPTCNPDEDVPMKKIAYYQGWNSRTRSCDKVYPATINTAGLTHLMYSFVGFDPQTFEIVADPDDVPLFPQFTALKSSTLQTWVAVGGWSFNDPGATFNAFSDMVSTASNRAAFIKSLIIFMDFYGFQGADIDWEYPSEPKRGGRKADKLNLVELMKDMRAAFGTKYGLSVVLAPDYWYLQGFAPRLMQEYVDHMGFMAYDLHGPWDSENALGNRMRAHTDIRDIENGLTPLWFDGVDPKKVILGLAYYGRTFTASSPNCPIMGCPFKGPGKAYGCTNFAGVLSNMEIRRIVKETGIQPVWVASALVKELVWDDDQWVAFDDKDTIALKTIFAKRRCLGGTMIWSIDYDSPTSDVNPGMPGNYIPQPQVDGISPHCALRSTNPLMRFTCITCSDPGVDGPTLWPVDKWKAARGDEALEIVNQRWENLVNNGQVANLGPAGTYVRSLAVWFKAEEAYQWVCKINFGDCDDRIPCRGSQAPAVSMILSQWANIRLFYTNQYHALNNAAGGVGRNAGNFAKIFAPQLADPNKGLKILIDVLGIGFGLVSAGLWNTILKRRYGEDRKDEHGWSKDGSNSVVMGVLSLGKDTLKTPPNPLTTQNTLSSALELVSRKFAEVIDTYVNGIFSGSAEGRQAQKSLLQNGKWLDPAVKDMSWFESETELQKILYGLLLTKAWSINGQNHPFIVSIDKLTTANPSIDGGAKEINGKDLANGRVYYQGKTYILLDFHDCTDFVNTQSAYLSSGCRAGGIGALAGIETLLDAKASTFFGEITKEDLVISAVQGWQLNGNKNGYKMPEESYHVDGAGTVSELMFENGIRTPGMFNFPICDWDTANGAWIDSTYWGKSRCEHYPCCKDGKNA